VQEWTRRSVCNVLRVPTVHPGSVLMSLVLITRVGGWVLIFELCRQHENPDTVTIAVRGRGAVHGTAVNMPRNIMLHRSSCRLCLGGKDSHPTQFNTAIACGLKLTLKNPPTVYEENLYVCGGQKYAKLQ
jgi:hypothetical protein